MRFSNLNDAIRAVPEGKVDATFAAIGIGINEEANAMEPIRFLSLPPGERPTKYSPNMADRSSKQEPTAGIRGDTDVIGYPLHLATSTKVNDRTVARCSKRGGIISPSCKRFIRNSKNGPRMFRRSPISPCRIMAAP